MKKLIVFTCVFFFLSTIQELKAQNKDRTLKNGFSIGLNIYSPTVSYGRDEAADIYNKYGLGAGLQIGNRWYISADDDMGIGVMVNWFDLNLAVKIFDEYEMAGGTLEAAFFEIGPVGTYRLNKEVAIDGYLLGRPTFMYTFFVNGESYDGLGDLYGASGVGITYALGGAIRWRALSVGLEFGFGRVDGAIIDMDIDSPRYEEGDDTNIKSGNIRLVLGLKF